MSLLPTVSRRGEHMVDASQTSSLRQSRSLHDSERAVDMSVPVGGLVLSEDLNALRHPERPVSAPPVFTDLGDYQEGHSNVMPHLPTPAGQAQSISPGDGRQDPVQSPGSLAPRYSGKTSERTIHIMREVTRGFDIGLDAYEHIERLVQQGLVSDLEGAIHAADVAGVPRKAAFTSPLSFASGQDALHSVSLPAVTGVPSSWAQSQRPERLGPPQPVQTQYHALSPRVAPHKLWERDEERLDVVAEVP